MNAESFYVGCSCFGAFDIATDKNCDAETFLSLGIANYRAIRILPEDPRTPIENCY